MARDFVCLKRLAIIGKLAAALDLQPFELLRPAARKTRRREAPAVVARGVCVGFKLGGLVAPFVDTSPGIFLSTLQIRAFSALWADPGSTKFLIRRPSQSFALIIKPV